MLNFDFLEIGLGIVSPPHFLYGFSRKMFLEQAPHEIFFNPLVQVCRGANIPYLNINAPYSTDLSFSNNISTLRSRSTK